MNLRHATQCAAVAILLATPLTADLTAQQSPAKSTAPAGLVQGYLDGADGVGLFYRKLGTNSDVVVFLHGGPGASMHDGGFAMDPLARNHTLIMYDQRGGGRSDIVTDKSQLTAAAEVRDLEAVRQHFAIEKMKLIGLSWGSGLAVMYADAHPERVSKIVFLDPMPVARDPFVKERGDKLAGLLTPAETARLKELQKLDTTANDEQIVANCREEDRIAFKAYVYIAANYDRNRSDACDDPPAAIRNAAIVFPAVIDSLANFDFRPMLKKLHVPVLVIEGAKTNVPLDSTQEWANNPPNARLVLIPDAGHASFVDQPDAVIRALESFLSAN